MQEFSSQGRRENSAIKNTYYFSSGQEFSFQNLHGDSPQSITPVPRDSVSFSGCCGIRHACGTQLYLFFRKQAYT